MEYDKYSDQLLAQKNLIPANKTYEILLGYSFAELSKAEEVLSPRVQFVYQKFKRVRTTNLSRDLLSAGKAYIVLKNWIDIKYPSSREYFNDIFGVILAGGPPTAEFLKWIESDDVLLKLKKKVPGFNIPDRAYNFIEYIKAVHIKKDVAPKPEPANKPQANKGTLREKFLSQAATILKKYPALQAPELLKYSSLQTLIRDSNISTNHIKKKWIPEARKLAGVIGRSRKGTPRKT
jgi:hypothetical protein